VREVAVEVDAAAAVFAEEAVLVEVGRLAKDLDRRDLALLAVRGAHDARIDGVDDVRRLHARWRDAPHGADEAVAVQVGRAVFIDAAVAVVVDGARVGGARLAARDRVHACVGVRLGDHIDARGVEHGGAVA